MGDLSKNPTTPLDPLTSLEPPAGSAHKPPPQLPPLPAPREPATHFADWKTIHAQRSFYDEHDLLHPSYSLTSEELENRGADEVVIFDYSLAPSSLCGVDGNCTVEGWGSSSGRLSADDRFLRAHKDMLIESEQFNQIVNPTKEPQPIQSRGPRLGIM